jgi:hypothetical protein
MSMPDHQVGGLRAGYAPETSAPGIEIFGIRVRIRKASALVDRVHQVGAIAFRLSRCLRVQGNCNQRRTVVLAQCAAARTRSFDRRNGG